MVVASFVDVAFPVGDSVVLVVMVVKVFAGGSIVVVGVL